MLLLVIGYTLLPKIMVVVFGGVQSINLREGRSTPGWVLFSSCFWKPFCPISNGEDTKLLLSFDFSFSIKNTNCVQQGLGCGWKMGQILPGILGRRWQLKDALVFGSDSSCGIQFKFTVAGRKSVNAKESKVFVNTLLCEPFKSGLHRLLPSPV